MNLAAANAAHDEAFAALLLRLRAKVLDAPPLLAALAQTPRTAFVEAVDASYAYHNRIIPISCGEYIERLDEQIAIFTALELDKHHRVLEIGTGSGFSTALMARLVARVTTIERYRTLAAKAQARFENLQLTNIIMHQGDAHHSLPMHHGNFDRILIWPAFEIAPQLFIDRLAANGMLIVPIGGAEQVQIMTKISKTGSRLTSLPLFPVRYQPMLAGITQIL